MTDTEQKAAAKAFAEPWKGRGCEKGESQSFWLELLREGHDRIKLRGGADEDVSDDGYEVGFHIISLSRKQGFCIDKVQKTTHPAA